MTAKKRSAGKAEKKDPPETTRRGNAEIERELKSNILKIVKIEKRQKSHRSFGEKVSEVIALFAGSMTFVYIHVIWFGGWVIYNSLLPLPAFDPFPYTFLTLVVSLEAIFLSTFILISQNHETQLTERRNQFELQINMLAEQENTKMLELLKLVAEKVGIDCDGEDLESLLEPIDPETLFEDILLASADGVSEVSHKK